MLHWPVATGLEDMIEAYQVALDISIRIGDAITHTSLGSQVHHHLRLVFLKDAIDCCLVGNIASDEGPAVTQHFQTMLLEGHIVVVVHIINTDDGGILHVLQQSLYQVRADKARSTSHKNGLAV